MTSTATAQTFLLPDLGEGLTEAEVVHWLVAEGDVVTIDQPVVEVETAKSVVEVPSPYAGRVGTLHAAEGELLEVGKPLITIAGEATGAAAEVYREEEQAGSGNVLIGYGTSAGAGQGRRRRPRGAGPVQPVGAVPDNRPVKVISPIVRRLAREAGLDLRTIRPTGAGGVVTRSDVWAAVESARSASAPAPASEPVTAGGIGSASASALVADADDDGAGAGAGAGAVVVAPGTPGERRIPLSGFQRAAARVLSRSREEIPEATVWVDVDATALWDLREAARTPTDPGPGLLAYLARFVVAGLKVYPVLNARLDNERDEIVVPDVINLGVAVQGQLGLVAPAVLGAGSMTTVELDAALRDLTARARVGKATAEELSAGTFTLNNYGGLRVDGSAAIINHPQVAILGLGRIIDRPWVVDGQIVPRKITQMSFVFDHRVCDGATAAGFLRSVADAVENPAAAIVRL
ncbi:dihydrolipoamide acetyltransferase family protein [Promicromonospora vindobonensis]|uniref:Dihydrolipoamide acetyltransferase component of pyruvate dehydrogenase complex n=1 Tax=Promicromonospora vindobonensis TaxID=195748 RepID=A0ABW5VUB2_9MICO